jgi:hypothetical protein
MHHSQWSEYHYVHIRQKATWQKMRNDQTKEAQFAEKPVLINVEVIVEHSSVLIPKVRSLVLFLSCFFSDIDCCHKIEEFKSKFPIFFFLKQNNNNDNVLGE